MRGNLLFLFGVCVAVQTILGHQSHAQEKSIYNRTGSSLRMTIHPVGQPGRSVTSPRLQKNDKWTAQLRSGRYQTKLHTDDGKTVDAGVMDFSDPRKNVSNLTERTTSIAVPVIDPATNEIKTEVRERTVYSFVYGSDEVDQNGLRFGITFRMCNDGVHLTSIHPNMPSTRCRWSNGAEVSLEPDDHIHTVNGRLIGNTQEMLAAVASSPQNMRFTVTDKRTGQRAELTTVLAW